MKPYVSNSGPIISFARAGCLEILEKVMAELWIPNAVYEELASKGKGKPGSEEVLQGRWIKKRGIISIHKVEIFLPGLGLGEREAITLAEETKGILLIDDRKARREAERRGIKAIGSLRVLKEAKERGLITDARPVMDKLRDSGLQIKEELYHQFLQEIGEG